jgi:predicted esterase
MKEGISREKLIVPKTANVFTMGKLDSNRKSVWIVFHGYGQSAKHFIKKFSFIPKSFIIAPEATNHFYLEGTSGRIGANWMTAYERESAISDYIAYLNILSEKYNLPELSNCRINILGFSQGVATLSRWYAKTELVINQIILWGALIPDELEGKEVLNRGNVFCLYGDNDEYILSNQSVFDKKLIEYKNSNRIILRYNGGHRIPKETLEKFYTQYWT